MKGFLKCASYYVSYNGLRSTQAIGQEIQFKILDGTRTPDMVSRFPSTDLHASPQFYSIMLGGGSSGNVCPENCAYCYIDNDFMKKCRQCLSGFALHHTGVCIPCPQGCSECFYGGGSADDKGDLLDYSARPQDLPREFLQLDVANSDTF